MLSEEQKNNIWNVQDYLDEVQNGGPDFSFFSVIVDKGNKSRICLLYKNKVIGLVNWKAEEVIN